MVMMPFLDRDKTQRAARTKDTDRVMLINADRVLYCGLLGSRSVATLGAITVHISLGAPFLIRVDDGPWQERHSALIMPYVPHQVRSTERLIASLNVEPECVDVRAVPWLQAGADIELEIVAERARSLYGRLVGRGGHDAARPYDIDQELFGGPLPVRRLDSRIASVVERIKANPNDQFPAEECAAALGLSFSRFLHLFRDETGTTFRRFRAWKRARSLLNYVNLSANLTDVALEVGYPDASHFSHSIRQIYGMKPKDIFAGSRRLAVLT